MHGQLTRCAQQSAESRTRLSPKRRHSQETASRRRATKRLAQQTHRSRLARRLREVFPSPPQTSHVSPSFLHHAHETFSESSTAHQNPIITWEESTPQKAAFLMVALSFSLDPRHLCTIFLQFFLLLLVFQVRRGDPDFGHVVDLLLPPILHRQRKHNVPVVQEVLCFCSMMLGRIPQLFHLCFHMSFLLDPRPLHLVGNFFSVLAPEVFSPPKMTSASSQICRHSSKSSSTSSIFNVSLACSMRSSDIAKTCSSLFAVSCELLYHVALLSLIIVHASFKIAVFSTGFTSFPFGF